jgi:hypothetical protein
MNVSKRRLEANKRNASVSTGPKTARGKLVSRNNALRHGLARTVASDPAAAKAIDVLNGNFSRFAERSLVSRACAHDKLAPRASDPKARAEIDRELAAKAPLAWRGSDETVSLDRETDLKRIPAIN